jgi:hypothetical protein
VILPRPAPPRRSETRELTHPCRVALNKLAGVRVWRNNVGIIELPTGGRLQYGLGIGSADLVGLVDVQVIYMVTLKKLATPDEMGLVQAWPASPHPFARFFALETKLPGKRPTAEQRAWASVVRQLGGFACVVMSVDEALAAVERCRAGESE